MSTGTWTEPPRPDLDLIERVRTAIYLERVDARLSWRGIGRRRRRRIRRELTANVLDAATHQGSLKAAFEALGDPADLAAAHVDAEGETRFQARGAVAWVLSAFALLQGVGIALDVGFRRGVEAAGVDTAVSYAVEFAAGFGPYTGGYVPGEQVLEFTLLTPAHVVVMLVAALIGGRTWRLLSRR